MRRLMTVTLALLLPVLLIPVSSVAAAPPLVATITVDEQFTGEPPGGEPFIATGSAVDAGVLCASGNVEDIGLTIHPSGKEFIRLTADKLFTCGDGSGTFEARLWVKLYPDQTTTAKWRITDGNGVYADVRGWGKLIGTPFFDDVSGDQLGITDVYTGKFKG